MVSVSQCESPAQISSASCEYLSLMQIKPDGVQRSLVGDIIARFERKGFTLKALKMFVPSKELAEEHYKDLSSKPFFGDLVSYIISGPVVAMVNSSSLYHPNSLSLPALPYCSDFQASAQAPSLTSNPSLILGDCTESLRSTIA